MSSTATTTLATTASTITTVNPATGADLSSYESWTAEQIEQALAAARRRRRIGVASRWRRGSPLRRLAGELRHQKDSMAALITTEMGKPLAEAAAELEKSAVTADYYADQAEAILGDEAVPIDGVDVWISYEPIGLVLAVMPWNFPVWQVMRFATVDHRRQRGVAQALPERHRKRTGLAAAVRGRWAPRASPHRPGRRRAGRPEGHRLADQRRPNRGRAT